MWAYNSNNGKLSRDGVFVGTGYSGHGVGLNDPTMAKDQNVGPIPAGVYAIGEFFDDPNHPGKGPLVAHLIPAPTNEMFGRSGFMIHGNSVTGGFQSSHGCIILAHDLRQQIADSGDTTLTVV